MGAAMTAIAAEIERFNRLSRTWWQPDGPMRPLHVVNALRLEYVVALITRQFRVQGTFKPFAGLRMLDVGCGGGLMSEPLSRLGARVVGVDASPGNVAAARLHAEAQGLNIDYRVGEPGHALNSHERFDVVLALEVVEHVSDVDAFMDTVAQRVAPNGLLVASTIDRTLASFVIAIVGAEYVMRVLPRGTHQWQRFVRPGELALAASRSGLAQTDIRGMAYNPFQHTASWCRRTHVNYISVFAAGKGTHAPAPNTFSAG
jgi:2-polyprenyl-6-hydroxyphenyl methylase/3-demethylubiquinone-9 3-methyltransferase